MTLCIAMLERKFEGGNSDKGYADKDPLMQSTKRVDQSTERVDQVRKWPSPSMRVEKAHGFRFKGELVI
ncbi:hypothetical protein AKJ16_DCAP11875 [Drosera capensis]